MLNYARLKSKPLLDYGCVVTSRQGSSQLVVRQCLHSPFPWGIQAPTYYMVPWAQPSSYPKRHLDWFIHYRTAHADAQTVEHR